MSLLLCFFSVLLSLFSTSMMCYTAMAVVMAPWVAPVLVVVVMVLSVQFVGTKKFKDHSVLMIASGSMGGVIGMCLGLTWPSLYFLHEDTFMHWMQSPWKFSARVALLVFSAGIIAFFIAFFLRRYLIVEQNLRFPMSQLVHNIIYLDNKSYGVAMLVNGGVASTCWNVFTWVGRQSFKAHMAQLHAIPVLVSIGFVAGQSIASPLLIGVASKILSVILINNKYFLDIKSNNFLFTFSAGMLLGFLFVELIAALWKLHKRSSELEFSYFNLFYDKVKNIYFSVILVVSLAIFFIAFFFWNVSWLQQLYVLFSLFIICNLASVVLGTVGVVDIQGFVSFMILPFSYFFYATSYATLFVIAFSTLCLGLVVDLLFSYKLAHLAKISHMKLLFYQILGFIASALTVGFILWWYIDSFTLGSNFLLAQQALNLEIFITFSNYNYYVLALGAFYSILLSFIFSDLLVIISGLVVPTSMSFWLILAGGFSYLFKKREKLYPFCFGLYASHSVWMIVKALIFTF